MAIDIIKDPITGQQFSRDISVPGSTYRPYTPPTTITSDLLQPQADLSKQITTPITEPVVTPDAFALTPEQQALQKQTEDITRQQTEATKETAFQAEQEVAQGIPEATKILNDLLAQQQVILNEQAQIQLTKPAAGQGGLATALIERRHAERLRENAVSALAINSLVAAAQGKVATAQSLADRAVRAKFDPLKARIEAAIANLNLILQSPAYTQSEKRRAQAQKDIQNRKEREIEQQEREQEQIYKVALEAARSGVDALTLQNIQKSKTAQEALQIAGPSLQRITEREDAFTVQQRFANERALITQFNADQRVKDFREIGQRFDILNRALEESKTTGNLVAVDQAIISAFNKITDPTSVVRESEYARTTQDLSLLNKLRGKVEKVLTGGAGLTQEDREAIVKLANQFFEVARGKASIAQSEVQEQAQKFGLQPSFGADIPAQPIDINLAEPPPEIKQEIKKKSLFGRFIEGILEAFK